MGNTVQERMAVALALLFGLGVAYLNLHTDETPFVAIPLFAATAVLGFLSPRRAWRWTLLVGLWLPLSQGFAWLIHMRVPYPNELRDISGTLIPALVIGLPGAYGGALVRWLARVTAHEEGQV